MTPMSANDASHKRARGLLGLLNAIGHSWAGFRHAVVTEAVVRQEIIALGILVPISAWLPVTNVEHLILDRKSVV